MTEENERKPLLTNPLENKIKEITSKEANKIRMEKIIQSQFEKKMARIKKLKSKQNRGVKKRLKMTNLEFDCNKGKNNKNIKEESTDSSDQSENDNKSDKEDCQNIQKPKDLLNSEGNKFFDFNTEKRNGIKKENLFFEDFINEKEEIINEETEKFELQILPGWNEWGNSLNLNEIRKSKHNFIEKKQEGIQKEDRKDFQRKNVICNEKFLSPENLNIDEKERENRFKTKLKNCNKDEYELIMQTNISKECNLIADFDKIIKPKKKRKEKKASESFRYF